MNVVPRLPQVLPAKVATAEFALIFAVVAGAIVAAAFRIAVINARVKPFSSGIAELLVSHSTEWNAANNARLLVFQNGVVFLASDMGALKSNQFVIVRVFNNHATKSCKPYMNLHDFIFYVFTTLFIFYFYCNSQNQLDCISGSLKATDLAPVLAATRRD